MCPKRTRGVQARLSHRSPDTAAVHAPTPRSTMESEESRISVWVCREEKLVLGLSKRTSCADVVQVLLEEQTSQRGPSAAQSYCIVEKWRGFERVLPNTTKILRLWVAWGEERSNVKFVLLKSDASSANHAARSAEARVVRSKHSPCVARGAARGPAAGISPEKQRRVVRKAFRKLEKMNKRKAHEDAARSAERMETLVHVVVSRDHTIRQQIDRLAELDAEIDRCEAEVHRDRVRSHGLNYVHDSYLLDAAAAAGRDADQPRSAETVANFETYVRQCEELVELHEELRRQEALVDTVTAQLQEELNRRWTQRRNGRLRSVDARVRTVEAGATCEHELFLEEDAIKSQLDASSCVGLRLSADLEAVRSRLELTQELHQAREKEMRDLLEKVATLDTEGGTGGEERRQCGTGDETGMMSPLGGVGEWGEQARGLSKAQSADDDSDTGLSSLHSQDSDSHLLWESLV